MAINAERLEIFYNSIWSMLKKLSYGTFFYSINKTSLLHLYRNPVLSLRPHAIYNKLFDEVVVSAGLSPASPRRYYSNRLRN